MYLFNLRRRKIRISELLGPIDWDVLLRIRCLNCKGNRVCLEKFFIFIFCPEVDQILLNRSLGPMFCWVMKYNRNFRNSYMCMLSFIS